MQGCFHLPCEPTRPTLSLSPTLKGRETYRGGLSLSALREPLQALLGVRDPQAEGAGGALHLEQRGARRQPCGHRERERDSERERERDRQRERERETRTERDRDR